VLKGDERRELLSSVPARRSLVVRAEAFCEPRNEPVLGKQGKM
jgi:hypothetical protein